MTGRTNIEELWDGAILNDDLLQSYRGTLIELQSILLAVGAILFTGIISIGSWPDVAPLAIVLAVISALALLSLYRLNEVAKARGRDVSFWHREIIYEESRRDPEKRTLTRFKIFQDLPREYNKKMRPLYRQLEKRLRTREEYAILETYEAEEADGNHRGWQSSGLQIESSLLDRAKLEHVMEEIANIREEDSEVSPLARQWMDKYDIFLTDGQFSYAHALDLVGAKLGHTRKQFERVIPWGIAISWTAIIIAAAWTIYTIW